MLSIFHIRCAPLRKNRIQRQGEWFYGSGNLTKPSLSAATTGWRRTAAWWSSSTVTICPRLFELAEAFLRAEPETVRIFAVWGHSYEFEVENTWQRMEEFCRLISGRADVFYGTNSEVLLADRP